MPPYNSPFIKPQLLMKGVPAYFFGGLNMLRGNTSGTVTNDAIAINVATVTIQINQGQIPLVGDIVTIWGTANSAGAFNVTRAVITGVSITATTGSGTVTFALTASNQSATADGGQFLIEVGETSETLTTNTFSIPITVQAPQGDSQFTLPLAVSCPSMPTAATFTLQVAIRDIAAEYTAAAPPLTIAAGAFTAGPVTQVTLQRGYVYRLAVTGVTGGTSPTVIAKIG